MIKRRRTRPTAKIHDHRIPICGTYALKAANADRFAEDDHGRPSIEVAKRKDSDHHPKSDPVFFTPPADADTSAVRGSLSPRGEQ